MYISSWFFLVVFMISVSVMVIVFLILGYFFKIKEIKFLEMVEDWNIFLLWFNDLDLCVLENEIFKYFINDIIILESIMISG